MPYAQASDGSRIYYEVHGSGPTLFLGPPLSATRPRLIPNYPREYVADLSRSYRVIVADLIRGTGRSDARFPACFMPEIAVSDILAVADAAGAMRFAWFGFSWGAVIGLQLALRSGRLTALACGGWSPIEGPYRQTGEIAAIGQRAPFRWLGNVAAHSRLYMQFYEKLADWSIEAQRAGIATIGCPRLAFMGKDDNTQRYDIRLAERLRRHEDELQSQGWQVRWIPDAGHGVIARPRRVLPLLHDFLDPVLLSAR